ncbi:glycosyltransferase family 4 protein [Hymenobacter sp. BT507]|uniref:Glycosyltransferase family 4 protein n=1 Tax=Hymenobacter citatus TaxID=2763506 RepID=A0ABR7MKP5_9BACT|nr:glycosyltransferase family 4 protein [Hymenobacter citatus]MBC6611659.1 glycosyltransferase family 4 protein [Hymenobacter citatus]
MRILIAIEDLRTGGAQVFAMRLAEALHNHGHQVWLYCHYANYINKELLQRIAPDIPVIAFDAGLPGLDWLLLKAQGALRRLKLSISLREQLVERHLKRIVQQLNIQLVNSHTIKSDYVATAATSGLQPIVPVVITMHGCYEDFLHMPGQAEVTFKSKRALAQTAGLVYLTQKNLEIFSTPDVRPLADIAHAQIYNGFEGQFSTVDKLPTRAQLDIKEEDIVFGMVARGIQEKGWQYALDSFHQVHQVQPDSHLILVGESEYLNKLKAENTSSAVHFIGFAQNPIDWVQLFDVGLLPSYFASESLPNSIAEYLFCGIPAVATRIGEIPAMLAVSDGGEAGILLEQNVHGLTHPEELTAAMQRYADEKDFLAAHKVLARQCFEKFRMDKCIAAYEKLFAQVQPR